MISQNIVIIGLFWRISELAQTLEDGNLGETVQISIILQFFEIGVARIGLYLTNQYLIY